MGDLLLDARGLAKTFSAGRGAGRRAVRAVVDVDIGIAEGETHGLVGESGSGKSTTGRIILRLVDPDAGSVRFRGIDLLALRGVELRRMRRDLQLIYQDPFSSVDPRFRVRDIVAEPWSIHGIYDRNERRRRAEELLARVGIDPSQGGRRPAAFSGGQLQRIGIARAIALEPSLIVCDEPVSALDVSVQGQILNLLMELKHERGMSYLFIAHDLAVVRHVSDRVSVMYAGRIVESGTREEIFERASHPYTQALIEAMADPPGRSPRTHRSRGAGAPSAHAGAGPSASWATLPAEPMPSARAPSGCAYRDRCPRAGASCGEEVPALIERGQGHPVACLFPGPALPGDPPRVVAGSPAWSGGPSAPYPRIDGDDRDVRGQVHEGDQEPGDDADAHDEGRIEAT